MVRGRELSAAHREVLGCGRAGFQAPWQVPAGGGGWLDTTSPVPEGTRARWTPYVTCFQCLRSVNGSFLLHLRHDWMPCAAGL